MQFLMKTLKKDKKFFDPLERGFEKLCNTGTPPLTRFSYSAVFYLTRFFLTPKPRYRRSILVLKPQNGEFES